MILQFLSSLIIINANNLYCNSGCRSCMNPTIYVNYQNISCLLICPTGYYKSSGVCLPQESQCVVYLNFLYFLTFNSTNFGDFRHPLGLPFSDPGRNSPIPTKERGFYFTNTSSLVSDYNYVLAPTFGVLIFANVYSDGTILEISINSTMAFQINFFNGSVNYEVLGYTGSYSYSQMSFQFNYQAWSKFLFTCSTSSTSATLTVVSQFYGVPNLIVKVGEFRFDGLGKITIGGTFKGFISQIAISNSLISNSYSFSDLPMNWAPNSYGLNGTRLTGNCSNEGWPWCIRSGTSNNTCYSRNCKECIGYGYSDCLSCFDSAIAPDCTLGLHCLSGPGTFNCGACAAGFFPINGLCLQTPYNYDPNNLQTPVIDITFDSPQQIYGNIFQSGANASTFSPYNNPQSDDPWLVKNRGMYFNGSTYLISTKMTSLNYQFSISYWNYYLSYENWISTSFFYMRVTATGCIWLSNFESSVCVCSNNSTDLAGKWIFTAVTLSFVNLTSTFAISVNNNPMTSNSINGYYYSPGFLDYITIGDTLHNVPQGFMYSFTLWNTAINSFLAQFSITTSFLWNCDINYYYNPTLNSCLQCDPLCTSGCSAWYTCNQCSMLNCSSCTNYNATCNATLGFNPCLPGYNFTDQKICCLPNCLNCFSGSIFGCATCYAPYYNVMYACMPYCPFGYIAQSNYNCSLQYNPIVSIAFTQIQDRISSSSGLVFSTGYDNSFYPNGTIFDPVPAMQRGYYFNTTSFMTTNDFLLPYNFTMVFIIKVVSGGVLMRKNDFSITIANNSIIITLNSTSYSFPYNLVTDTWTCFGVYVYSNTVGSILLGISNTTYSVYVGYGLFDDSFTSLVLGDPISSFVGFLNNFTIYPVFNNATYKLLPSVCNSTMLANCLWNCSIDHYFASGICLECGSNCMQSGCRTNTTCNLCNDTKCYNCSTFNVTCSTCLPNAYLSKGVCTCNQTYYWNSTYLNCSSCDLRCSNCSGPSNLECSSCSSLSNLVFLNGTCSCQSQCTWNGTACNCMCSAGYYWNGTFCKACNSSCLNCNGPNFNNCVSCLSTATLQPNFTCTCNTGFYWNSSLETCVQCDPRCLACSGPGSNQCLSCSPNSVLYPNKTCTCNNTFYWNSTSNLCLVCDSHCLTCYGGLSTQCLTCNNAASLAGDGSCTCDQGYLWQGTTCQGCQNFCATCSGTVLNCTSCLSNMVLLNNYTCTCEPQYYWNSSYCVPCDLSCATCEGALSNQCTSCVKNASLTAGNSCVCDPSFNWNGTACVQCLSNQYWSGELCQSCDATCLSCVGNSSFNCSSCSLNAVLQSDQSCKCNTSYYWNTSQCALCDPSCLTCFNSTRNSCLTCIETMAFDSINSSCNCPSNQYWNGTLCLSCHNSCTSCNAGYQNNCTSCHENSVLTSNNTCQCLSHFNWNGTQCVQCNTFEYWNVSTNQCETCDPTCSSCQGPGKNNCLSCPENSNLQSDFSCVCSEHYFWNDSACTICHPTCLNCSESLPTKCTSCLALASLLNNSCECNEGYFWNGSQCFECDVTCLTCDNFSNTDCLTCKSGMYLSENHSCSCSNFSYFNGINCSACSSLCLSCDGPSFTNCLSCHENSNLINNTCKCDQNFYWNGSKCISCNSTSYWDPMQNQCEVCEISCSSCTGPINCTECPLNAVLQTNGSCVCIVGYYWDGHNCSQCNAPCLECVTSDICTTCVPNSSLLPNLSCVCNANFNWNGTVCVNCSINQYWDSLLNQCASCDATCFNCTGPFPLNCSFCWNNASLQTNHSCVCNSGLYWNGSQCTACSPNCATCVNFSECYSCNFNMTLVNSNSCSCAPHQFFSGNQCLECDPTCHSCFGPFENSCTSCFLNADLLANFSCACSQGFFWNGTACLACDNQCLMCNGNSPMNCTSCLATQHLLPNNTCANIMTCTNGFYWNPTWKNCTACDPLCNICSGPTSQDCVCQEFSKFNGTQCVCNSSYYLINNYCFPCNKSCLECFGPAYYECLSCNIDLHLLENTCVELCPIGYIFNDRCVAKDLQGLSVKYVFNYIAGIYYDLVNNVPAMTGLNDSYYPYLDYSDPVPAFKRGLFFTGNGSFLSLPNPFPSDFLLFGPRFFVSLWINPYTYTSDLLSKFNDSDPLFSLAIVQSQLNFSINIDSTIFQAKSNLYLTYSNWNQILLMLDSNQATTASFSINLLTDSITTFGVSPFLDTKNSLLYISYTNFFKGFIYSLEIFSKLPSLDLLISQVCGTGCFICPLYPNQCIPDCPISKYYNDSLLECISCPSDCANGCRNSYSCSLCTDDNCLSCSSFNNNSCTECLPNFEENNGLCVTCQNTTFYDPLTKKCKACKGLCVSCFTETNCTSCKDNSKLTDFQSCECELGYYAFNSSCIRSLFIGLISIDSHNIVSLLFTDALMTPLQNDDIQIYIENEIQTCEIVSVTPSTYKLAMNFTNNINEGDTLLVNFTHELVSVNNYLLITKNLSVALFSNIDLVTLQINKIQSIMQVGMASALSGVAGSSIVNLNPSAFFTFLNSIEIFTYILAYNVKIDPILNAFLNSLQVTANIPNIFSYFISSTEGVALDNQLQDFGFTTNLFILNVGNNFTVLLMLILILPLLFLMLKLKNNWIHSKINKIIKGYRYEVFLRFWIQSELIVLFASIIGILNSELSNKIQIFDFAICLIAIATHLFFLITIVFVIYKHNNCISQIERHEIKERFGILFEEFDSEHKSCLFYLLFSIRRSVIALVVVFINSGIVQLTVSFTCSLSILVFVTVERPFIDKFNENYIIMSELSCVCFYVVLMLPLLSGLNVGTEKIAEYCMGIIGVSLVSNIILSFSSTCNKVIQWAKSRKNKVQRIAPETIQNDIVIFATEDSGFKILKKV